ncbi:major facilitator superfamily domain-containing protein [Mortierella sp. GBAus27b]|nr:major facilitator superfamily domain-containing protein [Mortierella sp. GBAus27b]
MALHRMLSCDETLTNSSPTEPASFESSPPLFAQSSALDTSSLRLARSFSGESKEPHRQGYSRWLILSLSCLLLFGNYFAYDNPAALNTQLQEYLGVPYNDYQYLLSVIYSMYSLPNTVLPFIFGSLMDRFGPNRVILVLSGFTCIGQTIFSIGVQSRQVWTMLLGRAIFGIGGESSSVAQASITTMHFRGHELAFALGLNLSIARLGSAMNTIVTPWAEERWGVPTAVWIGTLSCVFSFIATVLLVWIITHPPTPAKAEVSDDRNLHDESLHSSVATTPVVPTFQIATDQKQPSQEPFRSKLRRWTRKWLEDLKYFPTSFWLLCALTVLIYGTVVPFNSIASDFLQSKWYHGSPRKAAAVMGIPDTVGAVLVPILGIVVNRIGRRTSTLIGSASLMVVAHLLLGFTMVNPIISFLLLGLGCSFYGISLWPSIACVVTSEVHLGKAYGIGSSFLNISLVVVPPIVATIRVLGKGFVPVEMFFISMGVSGILAGTMLKMIDRRDGGLLEKPEKQVERPTVVSQTPTESSELLKNQLEQRMLLSSSPRYLYGTISSPLKVPGVEWERRDVEEGLSTPISAGNRYTRFYNPLGKGTDGIQINQSNRPNELRGVEEGDSEAEEGNETEIEDTGIDGGLRSEDTDQPETL